VNWRNFSLSALAFAIVVLVVVGPPSCGDYRSAIPIGQPITISSPLGLPAVPFPENNPPTLETSALGRQLFYDRILSPDSTASCATCHQPENAFSTNKLVYAERGGKRGHRSAPSLYNVAYRADFGWEGRHATLEEMTLNSLLDPDQMDHSLVQIEGKLRASPEYREKFESAFGSGKVTYGMVVNALATFQRTLLSGNSSFDKWYFGGEETAVGDSAKRGFEVFRNPDKGNCAACHKIEEGFALFTDNGYHNIGSSVEKPGQVTALGRFTVTGEEEFTGAYRTPSLRDVALTAPYLHDAKLQNLKDAVDFIIGGGNSNPYLDERMRSLGHLTGEERSDLMVFLYSLAGETLEATDAPQGRSSRK
jgi:cytochrome c peroxidase